MKNRSPKFFLSLFSLAVALFWIQQFFSPIKLAGLQGAFDPGEWPALTRHTWFSGSFQARADHYLKYHAAFNGELVRLRNQTDYTLFGSINTMLVLGKDRYIFDPSYVRAMEGEDLVSDSTLLKDERNLQAFLKEKAIPVVIVFAPNKASYYRSFLPVPPVPAAVTNRTRYQELLQRNRVTYIDFDKWFLSIRDTSSWPLIPKYGAHWSTLGAAYAGDSLIKKLEWLLSTEITNLQITRMDTTSDARFQDDDYLPSLNLMTRWKSPVLAYPEIRFSDGDRPNILFISDSFIWNFYDLGMMQHCFDRQSHVVYYNKTLYDMQRNVLGPSDQVTTGRLLKDRDAVVIITSDPSLKEFAFRFFSTSAQNMNP